MQGRLCMGHRREDHYKRLKLQQVVDAILADCADLTEQHWPYLSSTRLATQTPAIEVSGIAPRHSHVTSSTILRDRKRRPQANWSCTKSSDHRALPTASTRIGVRGHTDLRLALRLHTVDAVNARRLALPASEDEQSPGPAST